MSESVRIADLPSWLRTEVAAQPAGTVALLAGHYAIMSAGAEPVDMLEGGAGAPSAMVAFSGATWEVGCAVVAAARAHEARLMVLVDDVMGVRPVLDDRGMAERLSAALAAHYLERHPTLPVPMLATLERHGLSGRDILVQSESRWLFSERECRAALVRHVRRSLGEEGAALETAAVGESKAVLCASADGATLTVSHPEHGAYCLVHAGNTNCAGGYVEVIAEAYRRGVRTLYAMIPMRCSAPVQAGTALVRSLYALQGMQVVNIAIGEVEADAMAIVNRG